MTVLGGAGNFAPLAIGSILMVMIYAGGHISGGHYNPAVSLGAFIRGALPASDLLPYIVAQILAGIVAPLVAIPMLVSIGAADAVTTRVDVVPSLIAEFLGTFALVWVVLHTATAKGTEGNSNYGLAIGFTVTACAYTLGGFGSGGCFNPAVGVGTLINGLNTGANFGAIVVADLIAGALAAFAFKATYDSQGDDD